MLTDEFKENGSKYNYRVKIVDVKHLFDLHQEIEEFKNREELNGFQQWIVNGLYSFDLPKIDFEVKSILIAAIWHPMFANVELNYNGKMYYTKGLASSDYKSVRKNIKKIFKDNGYNVKETNNIPMKRFAVQSGLAVYGRNNITYVDDFGSCFSYIAFFTDVPCEKDEWRKMSNSSFCDSCNMCMNLCPTGAIRKDRFLIDNERCLSCINEGGGEFPDWMPKEVHHTLYDCVRCQEKCPLNSKVASVGIKTVSFSEKETKMLLDGNKAEDFSKEFRKKADYLELFRWSQGLARNIRAIMDNQSQ
jgi:epoxyqueuosine reductase